MGFLDRFRRGRSDDQYSAGGSRIYRHEEAAEPVLSGGDPDLIEAIDAHIERHLGEPEGVFHQALSPYVHVDIHVVMPTQERPMITLVTSGMSERPMDAPSDDVSRAELVMALPPDWPIDHDAFDDERVYWPFRLLQNLAVLPHSFNTWLWFGHTVPNGDPPEPYAEDTQFCCALLFPVMTVDEPFTRLEHGDHTVTFLGVYPLYADEMQLKLEQGTDALVDGFEALQLTERLQPGRASAARAS
ncbi:suppressor of fused domain protein [Solirubrobacter sp. CPCC 204708]|uniref:Suppressor of fused domain protein n=1 Tax=Solirubrobacter deserti TaxID=2282478 RepID=A0ABT4RF80_9ACTN|nr:suppressor of fused domain protein [Solirubrobacter deserti]MBE2319523.1 suppressor of fused domain protein [Solirubrobacter deserti]MDA0137190.1 suppressor of fused domain protein [Solirubrobacter deserti]